VATVPAEVHGPSDAELITSVRNGSIDAYGPLYERHVNAAYNLARQLSRSRAEADDLVSEAFSKVLDTLRTGHGPDSAFRAYLLTALRHVAYDKTRRDRRLELAEDVTEVSGVDTEKVSVPFRDTAVAGLERSMAARAFAKLPERWQAVLWHTEIEGQSPAEVAPLLGLTANGVSALAYRAREGLRQAYLQVHLAETTAERCRATVDKLGAWTRGGLSKRETTQVETHLDECSRCRALAAELADVNGALRLIIAPLVLGAGTAGYLALTGNAVAGTAVAVGAGAGAGVGGAAAGAAGGKAAAGAAAALPRQLLGVGGAAAAVAAALVIALASASTQHIPAAAAPPPPTQQQTPPAKGSPPANNPPPAQSPPAKNPPPTTPPSTPAPPPAPGKPGLIASGPASTVTLTPGGGPVEVPITASNTGTAPSGPVSATLNLPSGVSALAPGQGTAGPASGSTGPGGANQGAGKAGPAADTWTLPTARQLALQSQGLARQAGGQLPQVDCPGGTGTVTCTGPTSLQPGQSVVLMFRLAAAKGTSGGTITGTVNAGSAVSVQITVTVQVPPPPPPPPSNDGLSLTAREVAGWQPPIWLPIWLWPFNRYPTVQITATNTGTSTKIIDVDLDRTGTLVSTDAAASCLGDDQSTACHSIMTIAPNQTLILRIRLYGGHRDDSVTVTGVLGSVTKQVILNCSDWPQPLPPTPLLPSPNPSSSNPAPNPPSRQPQPPTGTTTTPPPVGSKQPGPPPQPVDPLPPVTTRQTPTPSAPSQTPTPTAPPIPGCTDTGTGPTGHNQAGLGFIVCPVLGGLLGPM
jgi:RNA polymerase sigma factor (sigma-70 family)